MKFDVKFHIVLFMKLILALTTVFVHGESGDRQCKPVDVIIFWDRNTTENVFAVQRHYILKIVDSLPEGSSVRIDDVGNTLKCEILLDIIKDKTEAWVETVFSILRENAGHHIIPYQTFVDATSSNKNEAVQLFYIVNGYSTIDDEGKMMETMEGFKKFVVYKGTQAPSEFWYHLASDKNRLLNLNGNIGIDVETFLKLVCEVEDSGSIHYCDRDTYWNGTKCNTCTYICSKTPSEDPPYCLDACKNFRTKTPPKEINRKAVLAVSNFNILGHLFVVVLVVNILS